MLLWRSFLSRGEPILLVIRYGYSVNTPPSFCLQVLSARLARLGLPGHLHLCAGAVLYVMEILQHNPFNKHLGQEHALKPALQVLRNPPLERCTDV
eukprot:4206596-Amphidinium_carterae.1